MGSTTATLKVALAARLDDVATAWLRDARAAVAADPAVAEQRLAAAARTCGRGPIDVARSAGVGSAAGWQVEDAVRVLILATLPLTGEALADRLWQLYTAGDAAERRAVLRGLPILDEELALGAGGVPIVQDALRANDLRLIAAALGPYAAVYLAPAAYRQAVLKCLFVGIPLSAVDGLADRSDTELVRMLLDYARERVAAGRDVPDDIWPLVHRYPGLLAASGLHEEAASAVPERRAAARRALAAAQAAADLSAPRGW